MEALRKSCKSVSCSSCAMRVRSASRSSRRRLSSWVTLCILTRNNVTAPSAQTIAMPSRNHHVCQNAGLPFAIATTITPSPSPGKTSIVARGRLHPPGAPLRIKNDLPPRARADCASYDNVKLVGTALCGGRDPGEFDGGSRNTVFGSTTTHKDAEQEEKDPPSSKTASGSTHS